MRLASERHGSCCRQPTATTALLLPAPAALNSLPLLLLLVLLLLLPPHSAAETSIGDVFLRRTPSSSAQQQQQEQQQRQCLYLDAGVAAEDACRAAPRDVRPRFCTSHAPLEGRRCDAALLERLRDADERARRVAGRFARLLRRFDCGTENSVSWTCSDCEAAYKQWVCAMFLPPAVVTRGGGSRGAPLKPCRYVCRLVEQRCPYFHPSVKEQYAGERVFKCIDPDIPDLDSMESGSAYGPPGRCYCPHHLDQSAAQEADPECRLLVPPQHHRRLAGGAPPPRLCPPLLLWTMLLLAAAAR